MAKQQVQKMKMQGPDFSVSKTNQDKAYKIIENYLNAAEKSVKSNLGTFSTLATVLRFVTRAKEDPSDKYVLEVIKRMEKDKLHSQISLQMTEITMSRLQNMQKAMIFKALPYLLGFLISGVLVTLILFTEGLDWSNPAAHWQNPLVQKYTMGLVGSLILTVWGNFLRGNVKVQLLASNHVFQAASAYTTAKMQGKGSLGALQNLGEMKRRAKSAEAKEKKKPKKEKSKK